MVVQTASRNTNTTSTNNISVSSSQSLNLLKNLFRVGISQICYIRNIFPSNVFVPTDYVDLKVNCLVPNQHPEADLLLAWLDQGVFDALKKKYLKSVSFIISIVDEDDCEEDKSSNESIDEEKLRVIEIYQWKLAYPDEGSIIFNGRKIQNNKEGLKAEAISCIRNLISFNQTLNVLPQQRILTMKLLYYDDRVPEDYEPQFFSAAPGDCLSISEDSKSIKIKIGSVTSQYHNLDLKFEGIDFYDEEAEEEDSPRKELPTSPTKSLLMRSYADSKGKNKVLGDDNDDDITILQEKEEEEKEEELSPSQHINALTSKLSLNEKSRSKRHHMEKRTKTLKEQHNNKNKNKSSSSSASSSSDQIPPPTGAGSKSHVSSHQTHKKEKKPSYVAQEMVVDDTKLKIVKSTVGHMDMEKVKSYIMRERPSSWFSITKIAQALNLPRDIMENAMERLVSMNVLEERSWGSGNRYQLKENALAILKGGTVVNNDDDWPPEQSEKTPMDDVTAADDNDDDETVDERVLPTNARKLSRSSARLTQEEDKNSGKRLASEYLLEHGHGFQISLTQESTKAKRKCSRISDPIRQSKRLRR